MKQSKAAKQAGKDNISNDFWKRLEGLGLDALVSLFQLCWDSRILHSNGNFPQVVGIFQKGSALCFFVVLWLRRVEK